jgi:signal transduction histidine kinase
MVSRWGIAMWPSSLAGRLLLSALFGLLAAGIAAAVALGAFVQLRDMDNLVGFKLENELDQIEQAFQVGRDGRVHFAPWETLRDMDDYDALRRDTAFRIVDSQRRTVTSSFDGPALRALHAMAPGARTLQMKDDGLAVRLQVRERRILRAGAAYTIQAARSNRMVERLAEHARHLYLGAALASAAIALAVFGLVVYATLQRSMVPLRRASAIAAGIGPRALSARLHVDGIPTEMAPLIDALNSALQRLEQGFKVQQDFLAMAAHELKTPLTLLQAEIELGDDMNQDAMLREIHLLARQVHQLLHLAEVSEGHNYRFSNLSLWALADDAVDYLARLSERSGVSLHVLRRGPMAWVKADEGAAFVMLKNLLENAISHSPRDATVILEVSPRGFVVVDQGPGVARVDREHLFKRFWRASNASEGAGLGLAIVREICLAHGWEVRCEDADGGGACFVVAMPDIEVREDA